MEPETNPDSLNSNPSELPDNGIHGETESDVSVYKVFAILGYLIPFAYFIPLLDDRMKNIPFVRFHSNQQLILLIALFGVYAIKSILGMVFMNSFGMMLMVLVNISLIFMAIIGLKNAYFMEMKELPVIGHFRILK